MSLLKDIRFVWAMAALLVVWALGLTERIISILYPLHSFWGDAAGLLGAVLIGVFGRKLVRDADFSRRARWLFAVAWTLFFVYAMSDFLDEFLFPPDNAILGKRQNLHRSLEIVFWSSSFMLTVMALVDVVLESIAARRAARSEREKSAATTLETKRTQERLALFAHAIEQATESFVLMNLDGTLVYANRAFELLLRLPSGTAVGRTAYDLIEAHSANPPHMFDTALKLGSWSGEVAAHRADGEPFFASVTLVLFLDEAGAPAGLAGLARDITEHRRLEAALRASEERYRLIAEQATDLVSIHTRDSEWLYASPSVRAILGYTPEELLGKPAYALMNPDQGEALDALDPMDFLDPQPAPFAVAMRHKDGHMVHLETRVRTLLPGDTSGEPQLLAMSRDITERLRAEEERRQLDTKLQRAQRHDSLALLAGGVAHDFNNLLLVVLANADLLLADVGRETPAGKRLRAIQVATERAGELTRQMLTYTGEGVSDIQPVDLGEVVAEMTALLQASVPRRVEITHELAAELPKVSGDITELRQVVLNLITNASEAMGPEGGTVRLCTGTRYCDRTYLDSCVTHDRLSTGQYAFVEVSDTGAGMDKATIDRMFEPFFTTKFTGRGLGLASVMGIVRRHQGTVWLQSTPGRGTTMRALFPVLQD